MRNQASVDTYLAIKENGLLSKRRFEVYDILFRHGDLTAHEIVAIARQNSPDANQTGWNARLSELEEFGCIAKIGEKVNPISNQKNTVWGITDKLPTKPEKRLTKTEKLEQIKLRVHKYIEVDRNIDHLFNVLAIIDE